MRPARANIVSVGVDPVNLTTTLDLMCEWISNRRTTYICLCNIHSVVSCLRDENLGRAYDRAGLVTADGMPIVWVCKRQGYKSVSRVYGPDLMLAMCERSRQCGYRHFFYGNTPDVLKRLAATLQSQYPGMVVAGVLSPPFRAVTSVEDYEQIELINRSEADIVWVSLGCPKQEWWMAEHRQHLKAPVLVGVGYAFDVHSGEKKQAPLWMQRAGLEWAFRLGQEPGRIWPRVFLDGPVFACALLAQALGLLRFAQPVGRASRMPESR